MYKIKKITIVISVFLIVLLIAACGQTKGNETVNSEEFAVNQQESNAQAENSTDSKRKENETINTEKSFVNQQESATTDAPEMLESIDWVGEYLDENGDANLKIEQRETGYHIEIGIFRLTSIDDGIGAIEGNKLLFTATDASGNPIKGEIEKTDSGADVIFTDSTWEYIENGDRYSYRSE